MTVWLNTNQNQMYTKIIDRKQSTHKKKGKKKRKKMHKALLSNKKYIQLCQIKRLYLLK